MSCVLKTPRSIRCTVKQMCVGQLAEMRYEGITHIVLKGYDRLISLTNPQKTWYLDNVTDVELLPSGTVVEFTSEI